MIDAFEQTFKAIAVNYEGFSTVQSFFEYVNGILKKEKIEHVILYGLSLGGFLAQHYVRRYGSTVNALILSHAGTTKSKTIIRKVIIPGKIIFFFLPVIPQTVLNFFFISLAGRVQSGNSDLLRVYRKYSTVENLERRRDIAGKSSFSMVGKDYLRSIYYLGTDMEKLEKGFSTRDLSNWKGKILIIRTDNDPLAQDDGMFVQYYPQATIHTFHGTGHLTPFIRSEEMIHVIKEFLPNALRP